MHKLKLVKMEEKVPSEIVIPSERYDLKILQSLRRIIRAVDIHSRKLSSDYNITGPQLITLLAILEKGPMTISAISSEIHLSASTLVGIVDRLEEKGYIKRKRSIKDRRQVHISLTQKGTDFADMAPSPIQETLAEALNNLDIEEQKSIAGSLQLVVELMQAKEIDAAPILKTGKINHSAE